MNKQELINNIRKYSLKYSVSELTKLDKNKLILLYNRIKRYKKLEGDENDDLYDKLSIANQNLYHANRHNLNVEQRLNEYKKAADNYYDYKISTATNANDKHNYILEKNKYKDNIMNKYKNIKTQNYKETNNNISIKEDDNEVTKLKNELVMERNKYNDMKYENMKKDYDEMKHYYEDMLDKLNVRINEMNYENENIINQLQECKRLNDSLLNR